MTLKKTFPFIWIWSTEIKEPSAVWVMADTLDVSQDLFFWLCIWHDRHVVLPMCFFKITHFHLCRCLLSLKLGNPYLLKCLRKIPIFMLFFESRIVTWRQKAQKKENTANSQKKRSIKSIFSCTLHIMFEEAQTLPDVFSLQRVPQWWHGWCGTFEKQFLFVRLQLPFANPTLGRSVSVTGKSTFTASNKYQIWPECGLHPDYLRLLGNLHSVTLQTHDPRVAYRCPLVYMTEQLLHAPNIQHEVPLLPLTRPDVPFAQHALAGDSVPVQLLHGTSPVTTGVQRRGKEKRRWRWWWWWWWRWRRRRWRWCSGNTHDGRLRRRWWRWLRMWIFPGIRWRR